MAIFRLGFQFSNVSYPGPAAEVVPQLFEVARSAEQNRPLSLYVHVPFCERLCYTVACGEPVGGDNEWN